MNAASDILIGRRSVVFLAFRLASSLLGFVGLFFMTRYLGSDVYGTIALTMSLLATFNLFSDLGFGSAHVKRVSEGQDINDCVSTYAAVKIILTVITVVVTVVALLIWSTYLGGSITGETGSLILLFLLFNVLYNLSSIATTTYNATMEVFKSQLNGLVEVCIRIPLVIFVSYNRMGAIPLAYAYVIGALAVVSTGLFFLHRDKIKFRRPTLFRSYLKFALPLALISVVGAVAGNMDKLFIGYFDSPTAVGYYSSSQVFLSIFALIGAAVATMTFPSFSKLHMNGNMDEIRKLTKQAERYISMIGMPVTVIIIFFPTETAKVMLGSNFAAAGEPIRYLAIATMLGLLNQVHSSQVLAVNRPDLSAKLTLLSFMIATPLLLVFVPASLFGVQLFGMSYTGAAVASMLVAAIMFVVTRYIVHRLTGTGSNPRILLHVLAAIVAGLVIYSFSGVFPLDGWLHMIIYGLVSMEAFLLTLWLMREFDRDDMLYFLDLLNVRKLWHYVKGEMKGNRE
ncbi:MAG: flippase [Methanomassiliicoccales archaeon]|nr:flippase [Methanomassiliicoccales archaeon]